MFRLTSRKLWGALHGGALSWKLSSSAVKGSRSVFLALCCSSTKGPYLDCRNQAFFDQNQIVIYNDDTCLIEDMNGHIKYSGKFTSPVRVMIPTGMRNKYTLVTNISIETMTLK